MATGVRVVWFIPSVLRQINEGMRKRVRLAAEWHANKTKRNINRPVIKVRRTRRRTTSRGPKGSTYTYVLPESRSKPGEYPKKETGMLQRTIFVRMANTNTQQGAIVATPLFYGKILEIYWDRSYLVRTLNEERRNIAAILTRPGGPQPVFIF